MSNGSKFVEYASDFGERSFAIAFVKACAKDVAEVYADLTNQSIYPNIPVITSEIQNKISAGTLLFPPIGGVVQLSDSNWTTIFHSLGIYESLEYWAEQMASAVNDEVLIFEAEDTSGMMGCRCITPKNPWRRFYTDEDAETYLEPFEESYISGEPEPYEIVPSYETLFEARGISTVQPYCNTDRSVVADREDVNRIVEFHFVGETPQFE